MLKSFGINPHIFSSEMFQFTLDFTVSTGNFLAANVNMAPVDVNII